jgi:hypothetical protein
MKGMSAGCEDATHCLIDLLHFALHIRILRDLPTVKSLDISEEWLLDIEKRCKYITKKDVDKIFDRSLLRD